MHAMGRVLGFVLRKRGELAVFAAYLCMVFTFMVAYLDPSKVALVAVNGFNEANLELLLILVSLPAVARFLYSSMARDGLES